MRRVGGRATHQQALHDLSAVTRSFRLDLVRPLSSLRHVISDAAPDLVIPFDDRTRQALHQVYENADPTTPGGRAARRAAALARPGRDHLPARISRAAIMALASASGVRVPATAPAPTLDDVLAWMRETGGATVLKTDGSWGGREVAIAHDPAEATRAWRSRPPAWARIAKRLVVDRDPWPLRAAFGATCADDLGAGVRARPPGQRRRRLRGRRAPRRRPGRGGAQ